VPIVSSAGVLRKDQQIPTGSTASKKPLKSMLIMSPLKRILDDSEMAAYCVEGTLKSQPNISTSCFQNDRAIVAPGGDILVEETKPLLH